MSNPICIDCSDDGCEVCARRNHPAGKGAPRANEVEVQNSRGEVLFGRDHNSVQFVTPFDAKVKRLAEANVQLLLRKHEDYGPKNIALAPGGALNGLRVRMHDKLARINHLIDSGVDPRNESLADSFLDLANYALIAQLVLRGEWPDE